MRFLAPVALACLVLAGCSSGHSGSTAASPRSSVPSASSSSGPASVPRFAHVVVVVEENRSDSQVLGTAAAPYLNSLGRTGVVLTQSYGIRHPSQPNYLALFSGSTQGLTDDSCPHDYRGANLAAQLLSRGLTFAGFAESMPAAGFRGCSAGDYARKHAPWVDFPALPTSVDRPLSALPTDWSQLPTVSFVIPDLQHDMHDGTVRQGDDWLRSHLDSYVTWARTHDSVLIVTWDEDDFTAVNRIPGVLAGAHLRPGPYGGRVDHYTVLRTIEEAYGLPPLGAAAQRRPITAVWAG